MESVANIMWNACEKLDPRKINLDWKDSSLDQIEYNAFVMIHETLLEYNGEAISYE